MYRCTFGLFLISLAIVSCGPGEATEGEVIAKYRDDVEARLALINELGDRVSDGDESIGELSLPEGVQLSFTTDRHSDFVGNTANLHLEEATGDGMPPIWIWGHSGWITFVRNSLKEGGMKLKGETVERRFKEFLNTRYLAILHVTEYVEPKKLAEEEFQMGAVAWEIYVFDLKDGSPFGKLTGRATSSDTAYIDAESEDSIQRGLIDDLSDEAVAVIVESMQPFCEEGYTP